MLVKQQRITVDTGGNQFSSTNMDLRLNKRRIAILIDGDNAQPKLLGAILEEVSKYGKVTIRRVYGDWTDMKMSGWNKELVNNYSFNPIQKFAYTTGKNSTDSALIIDAMDILHDDMIDGFCIVSSDSDYTGLAKRLRESGKFVMGVGEHKTPIAFVHSCEIFTYCENIRPNFDDGYYGERTAKELIKASDRPENTHVSIDVSLVDRAFEMSLNEGDEAYISEVGNNIRKIDPGFDPRAYGYTSLSQLFLSLPEYEVISNMNTQNGLSNPLVRRKE